MLIRSPSWPGRPWRTVMWPRRWRRPAWLSASCTRTARSSPSSP